MFLLKLSLKNLFRHKKRTIITATIIAIAVFIFLFTDSLLMGLNNASYDNIINYSSSDIQIVNNNYWEEKDDLPLDNLLTENKELMDELRNLSVVKGVSEKLLFKARLNNGVDELPIQAIGIDSNNISESLNIKDSVIQGEFFSKEEKKVVLGEKLADLMDLKVGDYLTLLVQTKEETFNTIDLEIGGLLDTPNPDVNQTNVYLPLNIAQNALNLDNQITHLLVKIENSSLVNKATSNINQELNLKEKNIKLVPWNELTAVSVMNSKQGANQAILGIILLLAAIGIINTVILSALERMEEIGMMKAMGLRRRGIMISFILESTGIGIIGGVVGLILGGISIAAFKNYGIDFASLYSLDMGEFGIPIVGKIYGVWELSSFVFVFFFSVIVSMISSIVPSYWAANKNPVDAIHHR
ncbi:MAG: ABC transporter permease [Bacillota bacterium]